MNRLFSTVLSLCFAAALLTFSPVAATDEAGDSLLAVLEELDVKVELRDGVRLSANIFRPEAPGKYPALLMRTPYGNGGAGNGTGQYFAARGYVVVLQDVRGRFESEGVFDAMRNEGPDGFDTRAWLGEQPWCNGRIGTIGGSYVGYTQWIAAPENGPGVTAMFPVVGFGDLYDMVYSGGAFRMNLFSDWCFGMSIPFMASQDKLNETGMQVFRSLPLFQQDRLHGWRAPYYRDWLSHPGRDKFWSRTSIYGRYDKITAAACNVGGWFDICLKGTLDNFLGMTSEAVPQDVRAKQKLIVGPWIHGVSRGPKVGEIDFGEQSVLDMRQIQREWFDYHLGDKQGGIAAEPPVKIFVMGANQWRFENEWPLARTRYANYYLGGDGNANTLNGNGTITLQPAKNSQPDEYVYDPAVPVPSAPMEPTDQREIESRDDVLVFTSAPLKKALEVTGPLKVILHAASSAENTDFTAKLVDVHPDGRAFKIADGIIRASFRDGQTDPGNIVPGQIYKYEIDLWATSNLFKKGHRVRVEISSSSFPRFDRNLNTGNDFATETTWVKATQTIYHDQKHPSYIVLPVID